LICAISKVLQFSFRDDNGYPMGRDSKLIYTGIVPYDGKTNYPNEATFFSTHLQKH